MTIYSKPENALVAHDRLLDFVVKVGWMDEEELKMLRHRIEAAGYEKPILECVRALVDAIEEDSK